MKGKKENTLLVLYDLIGDRSCEGLKRVEDGSVAALFGHQQEHQLIKKACCRIPKSFPVGTIGKQAG